MIETLSRHLAYRVDGVARSVSPNGRVSRSLRTQQLPTADLRRQQLVRLREMLSYAAGHCRLYRERFAEVGFNGTAEDIWAEFTKLPLLSKDDIRDRSDDLVADGFTKTTLLEAKTGGSTGTSLHVFFDAQCQALRNAAAMRSDSWAGWKPGLPVGALWGNPPTFATLRERARNAFYDRLDFLDTMNMTAATMRAFFERSKRRPGTVLYGHAHSVFLYAMFLKEHGLSPVPPAGIITTSMMLLKPERLAIEAVFRTPVTDRYGCEEVGLIASECEERNGMHLNVDHLVVEVIDDRGHPASPAEEGRIVVTDLINHGMPLVRYELGDTGVLSTRACNCGRGLPLLERVTGRVADFLIRRDGSQVAGISMIERTLTLIAGIKQLQIVQEDIDRFQVNVVPDWRFSSESQVTLQAEFADTFGKDVDVAIVIVQAIDRLPSGNYRFSICRVPANRRVV